MGLAIEEQETYISFYRDDGKVHLYTSDTLMIARMEKMMKEPNCEWKLVKKDYARGTDEVVGCEYEGPRKLVSIKSHGRIFTEEQLKVMKERGKMLQEMRKRKEEN